MPVPADVTTALTKLQVDYESLATANTDASKRLAALTAAQVADADAKESVVSATAQVRSSRDALVNLINQQYAV